MLSEIKPYHNSDLPPLIVFPREVITHYPEMANALHQLEPDVPSLITRPGEYTDRTRNLQIDIPEGTPTVVIPGWVSGRHADPMLFWIAETGHTLRFTHPDDPRTPRAKHLELVMSDLEGRGNKPTVVKDGTYKSYAELHYAFFLASTLKYCAKADGITILDPHDKVSVDALEVPTTVITALREIGNFMQSNGMFSDESTIVIADEGAIGRALYFSEQFHIPIVARIKKKRINGSTRIVDVIGKENLAGKEPIIVDDMIASGGTLFGDARELVEKYGTKKPIGIVTHEKGVLEARLNVIENIQKGKILRDLILTNSTPYSRELSNLEHVHIVNIFPLLRRAVRMALEPIPENWDMLLPDVFPLGSSREYLARLHRAYPDLVSEAEYVPNKNETIQFLPEYHQKLRRDIPS